MMGNRRIGAIARGLLVVAALVLLPLAALLQAPRPGAAQAARQPAAAQAAPQDSLWALGNGGNAVGMCASPSSAAALSGCFSSAIETWESDKCCPSLPGAVTTDGVNVYLASEFSGGLSCPIADLGANCTRIVTGSWPRRLVGRSWNATYGLAAADGMIWIGQQDGKIYRCPANLPYQDIGYYDPAPPECTLLDDAGQRPVTSLLLANGRLYAGLANYGSEEKKQGILWSCDPQVVNSCINLDTYGKTYANSLAVGGGYLWAGLYNGIILRCDLDTANKCDTWDSAGYAINSVSYDGQGTLYAAVSGTGVIWSCPTATANSCSTILPHQRGASVAAGAGSVFSSALSGLYFGTSPFTEAISTFESSLLLYVPAGGPMGVGAMEVTVSAGRWGSKLAQRCDNRGKSPKAMVTVRNQSGVVKSQKIRLCDLRNATTVTRTFHLLDPGAYTVTARTKKYGGSRSFTVEQDRTGSVMVRLTRKGAAG